MSASVTTSPWKKKKKKKIYPHFLLPFLASLYICLPVGLSDVIDLNRCLLQLGTISLNQKINELKEGKSCKGGENMAATEVRVISKMCLLIETPVLQRQLSRHYLQTFNSYYLGCSFVLFHVFLFNLYLHR